MKKAAQTAHAGRSAQALEAARARRAARTAKAAASSRTARTAVAAAIGAGILLQGGGPADGVVTSAGLLVQVAVTVPAEGPTGSDAGSGDDTEQGDGSATDGSGTDEGETTGSSDTGATPESPDAEPEPGSPSEGDTSDPDDEAGVDDEAAPRPAAGGAEPEAEPGTPGTATPTTSATLPPRTAVTAPAGRDSTTPTATTPTATTRTASTPGATTPVAIARTATTDPRPAARRTSTAPRSALARAVLALFGVGPGAVSGPSAPPVAPSALLLAQWAWFRRGENPLFNQSPVVRPGQTGGPSTGQVVGSVEATDPDRDRLTYTLAEEPTRGRVVVNPDGTYVYTPDADLARTGGTVTFTVAVRDNDPAAPGLGGFTALFHDALTVRHPALAERLFGPHTVTTVVTVDVVGTGVPAPDPDTRVDTATGVVTGQVGPDDGVARTYTVTTPPSEGRIVIDRFGHYVYTPSRAAQQAAALTPGRDYDTFTVTVTEADGAVAQRRGSALLAAEDGASYSETVPIEDLATSAPVGPSQTVPISRTGQPAPSPDGRYVVVTSNDDGSIVVVETSTGLARSVGTGAAPIGAVFSPDSRYAYVYNQDDASIFMIDIAGAAIVRTISTGGYSGGGGTGLNPDGRHYDVLNYGLGTITTIDLTDGTSAVLPAGLADDLRLYSPDGARSYFLDADEGTVAVYDTASNEVVATIADIVGQDLLLSPDGGRAVVYDYASGKLTVIDTAAEQVVGTADAGRYPFPVRFSPDGSRVFVTSGTDRTLTVVDTSTAAVLGTVPLATSPDFEQPAVRDVRFTPDGSRAYVADIAANTVHVIDVATGATIAGIPVELPGELQFSADGTRIYVTSGPGEGDRAITTIDTTTNAVVGTAPAGLFTSDPVITPDGARVYVTNNGNATVTSLDTTTGQTRTITLGGDPGELVLSPDGRRLYVSDGAAGTVTVIDTADDAIIARISVAGYPRVEFTADGRYAYSGHFYDQGPDAAITLISMADDRVSVIPSPELDYPVFSADGRYVYIPTDTDLRIVDLGEVPPAAGTGDDSAA